MNARIRNLMLSLFAALLFSSPLHAEISEARIIAVVDGDTVKIQDQNGMKYMVSLSGVDAPEVLQAHGKVAKDYLCSVICGKDVVISSNKINTEGHVLATVYFEEADVNLKMLESGMAWQDIANKGALSGQHYRDYARAENNARKQSAGLWQDDMVVAPWRWREISRAGLWD